MGSEFAFPLPLGYILALKLSKHAGNELTLSPTRLKELIPELAPHADT